MEPVSIRIEAEQLRPLLESWSDAVVTLRPVQEGESDLAAELMLSMSRELRPPAPSAIQGNRAHCASAVEAGDLLLFVEAEGTPVGTLRGEFYAAADGRREFYLSNIGVLPRFRSAGLGARLMRHLEGWVAGLGGDAVTLDFMADNPRVAPFYRRLGFEIVGYDLLAKLDPTTPVPRPAQELGAVRECAPGDEALVVRYLVERHGLRTFEQPLWTERAIVGQLELLATAPEQRLFIAEREGTLAGLCWALSKPNKRGLPIAVTTCFESDGVDTTSALLDALDGFAAASAATESYVTLWQPCVNELELLLSRAFVIGRYKARKRLSS